MKVTKLLLIFALVFWNKTYSQKYKDMMNDNSVNFYEVVKEAESYFKTIDIDKKGSGYKKFMRWASGNEYKYYPSGDRSKIDHAFPEKAYSKYISTNKKSLSKNNNVGNWIEVGPVSIEDISGHYAAGIGRIDDFQVNPNNTNEIYASSRSGGLWKTTNEGETWTATATETLKASGVDAIAVDPLNFNHVFITVQNAINNYSYGIYESFDGGASFAETRFNPQNLNLGGLGSNFRIYSLVSHPTQKNILFAGTSRGMYKTIDNFNTWTKVINGGQIIQIETHPTQANVVYAYSNSNRNTLFRSSNTGSSFSTTTINGNNNNSAKIGLTNNAPNDVYIASAAGIFRSTNSGQSFSFVSNQLSGIDGVNTDVFCVNSNNRNNMIIGGVDAANSTDGGANFFRRTSWFLSDPIHGNGTLQQNYFNTTSYVHADLRKAKSVNGVFYVATDGLLAKSTNQGVSWKNLMLRNTPGIRENYKLGVSQSNNQVVICGSQDNGTSIKTDSGWVEAYGADGMEGIIAPLNPNYMIGSIQFGDRLRTTSGGRWFTSVSSTAVQGWWEAPLAFDPNDQFKIYDFKNGIHVSNDFGMNYQYVGTPEFLKINPGNYWQQIRNAEIAQNNSKIIIVSRSSEIEKSTNGGASFTSIRNGLPNREIQDIAFNPNNDNDIIVVYANYENDGNKIYRSTNGGASWSNITLNMGNIPTHAVVIDHTANPNIYIGTEIGVYYKPLNGNTWTLYNNGLPNVSIQELEINYGANMLKAATWGRGLWEYKLVNRENYPSIEKTEISTLPTLKDPKQGTKQIVTSIINYKGNLTNVEVRYSVNNLSFNNVIPMFNVSGNTWATNTSLPTNTKDDKVYFKVYATGDKADETSSYKFMYEVKESVYCSAKGKDGTGADYITEVKLGDFTNTSAFNSYTLYNNLETITLETTKTYQVSVKLDTAFPGDKAAIWIDFDGDTTFSNNEEVIMSAYNNNIATGTIIVPTDAVLNKQVRMRVSNIYVTDLKPCNDAFGEVEDYILNFVKGETTLEDTVDADGYCTAKGKEDTGADFITEVKLGDFVNTSAKNNYTLYNNLEAINLETTKTYQVSVKLNTAFPEDKAAIWIDFNGDTTFSNNELVTMSNYNNNIATGTIIVPTDAVLNKQVRMRVSNIYNVNLEPCTDAFGEVEDYILSFFKDEVIIDDTVDVDGYCTAKGKDGTGADFITEVKLGDFVNTSAKNNYTLYNNLEAINLETTKTYQVSVKLNTAFPEDKAAIWIDFNGDATFSNNELITMSNYNNNIATGTILVPTDAVLNKPVRMRVSNIYNANLEPCTDAFGEVEDYIITFTQKENTYCNSRGKDGTGADFIAEVKLGDFINTSNTNDYYKFYNNLETIELKAKKTYQLSVRLGFAFAEDKAAAWIDFNGDKLFSSNELINMSAYNDNSMSTGTISIPQGAKLNQELRMRVSNIYNANLEPCAEDFGEVEDYIVVITESTLNTSDFQYDDTSVNIYPVPSKKYVYIKSDNIISKIELFDLNGRKVVYQNNLKDKRTKFDIEYLPKSVYILYIYTKNKIIVKKIVRE